MRIAGLALALTVGWTSTGAAQAQVPAPSRRVAHLILEQAPIEKLVTDAFAQVGDMGVKSRPEWVPLARDAVLEEMKDKPDGLERLFGAALDRTFSPEELRQGFIILSDPAVKATLVAGAKMAPAAQRAAASTAGQSFLKKSAGTSEMIGPILDDYMILIYPGMLRRLADKVEANEMARAAR